MYPAFNKIHRLTRVFVPPGMLLALFIGSAVAQSTEELLEMSIEQLLDVKVTAASRSQRSVRDLAATVHVITRKEIINNGYVTLVDALEDLPGTRVAQPGSGTYGEQFVMRGLWGNKYGKILVNGVAIQPSSIEGMPISEQINMRNIERIEVVYGPAAALFGADALSGIINIITLSQEKDFISLDGALGAGGFGQGDLDYRSGRFLVNQTRKGVSVKVYGGEHSRDDLNIEKSDNRAISYINNFGAPVVVGKLPEESNNLGLEIKVKGFSFSFDHAYRVTNSSLEQDSKYYLWDNSELIYGETIRRATLSHNLSHKKLKFGTTLSYIRFRLDTKSAFGMIYYDTPLYKYMASDDIVAEETVEFNFNENLEFVAGVSVLYAGAMPKTNDLTKPFDEDFYKPFSDEVPEQGVYQPAAFGDFGFHPITYHNIGGFLQAAYTNKQLALTGGLRVDAHSEYEMKLNPRVAGLYHFGPKVSIRTSFNQAYKAPTPYKVYNEFGVENADGTLNYMQISNEKLQPEELSAGEAGLRITPMENLSVELVGYQNKISALMTSQKVALDPKKYPNAKPDSANTNVNSDDAESLLNGLDIILSYRHNWERLTAGISSYTSFTSGEETLPNGDEIDIFRKTPKFIQKIRLHATFFDNWYIGLDNMYCGEWYARVYTKKHLAIPDRKSGPYFLVDFVTNYSMPTRRGTVSVNLKIDNLLDETYGGYRLRDNPQYQRTFYASLSYTL